jgi:hypothetical protein
MARQRYLAVRVIITHDDGGTVSRDYVRGTRRISEADFFAFALGHLMALTTQQGEEWVKWDVYEVQETEIARFN